MLLISTRSPDLDKATSNTKGRTGYQITNILTGVIQTKDHKSKKQRHNKTDLTNQT